MRAGVSGGREVGVRYNAALKLKLSAPFSSRCHAEGASSATLMSGPVTHNTCNPKDPAT